MISVVIPAFNEEASIRSTIEHLRALPAYDNWELLVVDDGSSDRTAEVAAALSARVMRHPHNLGYGRALKTGIAAATYDTIVIMDADGTYDAGDIPQLLAAHAGGFDMVVGLRSGVGQTESTFKTVLRWILTVLVEFTAGRRVPDVNSGLRVFSRTTIQPYFGQLCDSQAKSPVKTLGGLAVERQGEEVLVHASARSFLHHQVRSMVGSLVLVGDGKWRVQDLAAALAARDRSACGQVAPPEGLYLVAVDY